MRSILEKATAFADAHKGNSAFLIPNPWDVGSARMLHLMGFKALATTGAGYAFSRGRPDNTTGRDEMMAHLRDIAASVDVPVSADLENGYGDSPSEVADTIRHAAKTGVVGGSIEDSSGDPNKPIYPLEVAVERIRAASEVGRSLSFPFTLTARAENYFVGILDLNDTIRRLQAYQEAGADVLFAPGLTKPADIAAVVRAVDRPVNVLMGFPGAHLTLNDLSEMGVKRVSVGGSLCRAALGAFFRAAQELRVHGTFSYGDTAMGTAALNAMLR